MRFMAAVAGNSLVKVGESWEEGVRIRRIGSVWIQIRDRIGRMLVSSFEELSSTVQRMAVGPVLAGR
jgi:hypothetical protein